MLLPLHRQRKKLFQYAVVIRKNQEGRELSGRGVPFFRYSSRRPKTAGFQSSGYPGRTPNHSTAGGCFHHCPEQQILILITDGVQIQRPVLVHPEIKGVGIENIAGNKCVCPGIHRGIAGVYYVFGPIRKPVFLFELQPGNLFALIITGAIVKFTKSTPRVDESKAENYGNSGFTPPESPLL